MANAWSDVFQSDEPALVSPRMPKAGGVDPLGLRQLNFDLMDKVFPGINNVAAHIRPFTVVAWAWHHAAILAEKQEETIIRVSTLKDYVARIEVLFAWSQFLMDKNCGLPGRDILLPLVRGTSYKFGGAEWEHRKEARAYSTAISAPINYGPALKAFGWIQADESRSGAFCVGDFLKPALMSLEKALSPFLCHPVFSQLGDVEVSREIVENIGEAWSLTQPTEEERQAMKESISGGLAPICRKESIELVIASKRFVGEAASVQEIRKTMCGKPSTFCPSSDLVGAAKGWRNLQNRQAFRLALESLLFWNCKRLENGPAPTHSLVRAFLDEAGDARDTQDWLTPIHPGELGPVDWIEYLHASLNGNEEPFNLAKNIRYTLAATLTEAIGGEDSERSDRLPIAQATRQMHTWSKRPVTEFLIHIFDCWIFGQHVYWSVGRGLADARAKASPILRLRVTLEEDGWARTRNGQVLLPPHATPDRLETMISLMRESRVLP